MSICLTPQAKQRLAESCDNATEGFKALLTLLVLVVNTFIMLSIDVVKGFLGLLRGTYKTLKGDYKVFERCG
jgi:hypothetical protein